MTASHRVLMVLAAIVVALGVAVSLDRPRAPKSVVDHALLPGFDPGAVTELEWTRPGASNFRLVRTHDTWRVSDPMGDADPEAVGTIFAALRGGRWHRRATRSVAGQIHSTLAITAGGSKHTIAIADPLAGSDQTWIVTGESALLVDGWIARALDPTLLAVRVRHPLEDVAKADAIQLADYIRVEGHPREVVWAPHLSRAAGTLLLDEQQATQLEHALADLEFVALSSAPLERGPHAIRLEPSGVEVRDAGSCPSRPDLIALITTRGNGCVTDAQWNAILAMIEKLDSASWTELVDRRLAFSRPALITFIENSKVSGTLDATQATITIGGATAPADRERIRELQQALVAECEVATPQHADTLRTLLVPQQISLLANGIALRQFTPLRPHPDAWKILIRPPSQYRDERRWVEDPTAITTITIDGTTYARGAVIGEWSREPKGPVDAARIEALATALANVRAPPTDAKFTVAHRVTITITPPVGAPTKHELELGSGCIGRADGNPVGFPAELCKTLAAVAH